MFKVLLYLYWDLECYLENMDNVKNSLIVDTEDLALLKIKFKNKKKPDIWKKCIKKSITYLNKILYIKFNKLMDPDFVFWLRKVEAMDNLIAPSYYESYINTWYDEWKLDFYVDLTQKYKAKINELNIGYQNLEKVLQGVF